MSELAKTNSAIQMEQKKMSAIGIASKQNSLKGFKSTQISEVISGMTDALKKSFTDTMSSDRFVTMVATIFEKNPELKECSLQSIYGALQQTAILGLEPAPVLGHCYYVPYYIKGQKEVQFQIGYKGYLELARRSNSIADIYAEVVYEGDEFEIEYGLNRSLKHKPAFLHDEHQYLKYSYAVARFKDGSYTFAVLTKNQIEKRRKLSKTQKSGENPSGVWESHYAEMAKGKAVRALATYLPLSTDDKQRLLLPESQVIRRELTEPVKEFTIEEFQDTQDDDYNAEIEYSDINVADSNENVLNLINEGAKS